MIIINVTQEDIDQGQPHKSRTCPVALAIQRATNIENIEVGHIGCAILIKRYITFPDGVQNFIQKFDNKLPVDPFSFELDY